MQQEIIRRAREKVFVGFTKSHIVYKTKSRGFKKLFNLIINHAKNST